MARVKVDFSNRPAIARCRKCYTKHEIVVAGRDINIDGEYRQKWLCPECNDGKQRKLYGRTLDEIKSMGTINMEPVKVFNKKEIAAVAHLYGNEIPKKKEHIFR